MSGGPRRALLDGGLRRALIGTGLLAALFGLFSFFVLPVHGPWSGDTGVREMQTETLIATGDLAVPYLGQDVDPQNRYNPLTRRYFSWQGTRYYAKFAPAYAYLAAGIGATIGPRGYALPAIAGLALTGLALWAALDRAGSRLAWTAPLVAGALSPLAFYANELWEHSLATGLATAGAAGLLVAGIQRRWLPAFLGGLAMGAGLWLRGELYAFVPAALLALIVFRPLPWRAGLAACLGVGLLAVPLWITQSALFGAAEGAQVAVDSPLVLRNAGPEVAALRMLRQWGDTIPGLIVPQGPLALWGLSGLVLAGGALLLARRARFAAPVLGAGFGLFAVLVLVNFALRLAPVDLVVSFPIGLVVLLAAGRRPGRPFAYLALAGLLYLAAALVTAPSSGGAQHGPRYLLSIYPLWAGAAILAVERWIDAPRRWVLAAVGVLVLVSLATQVVGLRNLKVIKDSYAHVAAVSAASSVPLLTDLWWYPQIVPDEVRRRPIFVVGPDAPIGDLAAALRDRGMSQFIYVGSTEAGPIPDLSGTAGAVRLRRVASDAILDRGLVFDRYAIE